MNRSLGVTGAALLIGALCIPLIALAAEVRVGQSTIFSSTETTKGNLYLAGGTVSSSGKVQGDLVAGGGNILVSGAVTQDLLVGGGSINVLADVGGDVRIGGGNILIAGKVGNDVVVGGGQTDISGVGVGGDVVWGGGSLQVTAPVTGNMHLGGGQVTINTHVHGNVIFKGTKLTLGKDAVIDGDLDYSAQSEATMEAGALVKGKTTFEQIATSTKGVSAAGIATIISAFFVWKFLATLLFALVLGLVFRRYAKTVVIAVTDSPLLETGRGLIVLIVLPIASLILLVTLIGIPLGALGLIAFGALMLVAPVFGAILMGSLAHKWVFKPSEYRIEWQTILLGVVISTILTLIPFVGWIVKFLFTLAALGAMIKIKQEVIKEWR